MIELKRAAMLWALMIVSAGSAWSQNDLPHRYVDVTPEGQVTVDGHVFESWQHYFLSDYFRSSGSRCGTPDLQKQNTSALRISGSQSDCSFSSTNPSAEYDPSVTKYYIPVVVHVIQDSQGTGYLSPEMIRSQIDVLNEDYLALPGSNGAPGTDTQIEFFMATEDPNGNPTDGITYTTNSTWFQDLGDYKSTLAWDTNRYLNIYTNLATGALGYAYLPQQGGIVGDPIDGITILYTTFGRNAPYAPYDLGRVATHEVGHYLGLDHPFASCGSPITCYTSGDTICDTNPQNAPNWGCGYANTCAAADTQHLYMDYLDNQCMNRFTPEQARRMRCTLENWRPDLHQPTGGCEIPVESDCNYNCVIDTEEIAAGTMQDCNDNGIPDSCDLGSLSQDCNQNQVPDECEDCNENGIADACEIAGTFDQNSGLQSPIGFGAPVTILFTNPPPAVGDVTFTINAAADIALPYEYLVVSLNGTVVGQVFDEASTACSGGPSESIVISDLEYNTLVDGGDAVIEVTATSFVDAFACNSSVAVNLNFFSALSSGEDNNDNGIPDDCDYGRGDSNLDGVVDVVDLLALLGKWGDCAIPGVCPEDTNSDDTINVTDLLRLLSGWG